MAAAPELDGYALIASDGTRLATVSGRRTFPSSSRAMPVGRPWARYATRRLRCRRRRRNWTRPFARWASMAGPVRATVIRVRVASDGTLELDLHGGTRVSYGEPIQTTEKARSLGAVLRWASTQNEHLGSIDLGAPMAPTASTATTSTSSGDTSDGDARPRADGYVRRIGSLRRASRRTFSRYGTRASSAITRERLTRRAFASNVAQSTSSRYDNKC